MNSIVWIEMEEDIIFILLIKKHKNTLFIKT